MRIHLIRTIVILLMLGGAPSLALCAEAHPPASRIVQAYPDAGLNIELDDTGEYLLSHGERLLFRPASGCPEPRPEADRDLPVCSALVQPYPPGKNGREPEAGFNPGRTRNQALLKLLYGDSGEAVSRNCVPVPFLGTQLLFNARHGAAKALERVGERLETLVRENPAMREYILPPAGTVCWRKIAGSARLSAHSFGIAVDLNVAKGPYWRWSAASSPAVRDAKKNYPQEIVDAFEQEGFIWGGKWHAFDYMHFEYRPELLPANNSRRR